MNWILKHKYSPREILRSRNFVSADKIISQRKNGRALLAALFLVCFVTLFGNISNAKAANCDCDKQGFSTSTITGGTNTSDDCRNQCSAKGYTRFRFNSSSINDWINIGSTAPAANSCWGGTKDAQGNCVCDGSKGYTLGSDGNCKYTAEGTAGDNSDPNADSQKPGANVKTEDVLLYPFKMLLFAVLKFVGWLVGIAGTLFDWIVQPQNMNKVIDNSAVKDVWIMVRDFLNMFFILVLLFAAFCTVFQVDKWNLKTVWLNVLINALLVNFSYPIARIIIDVANVMMYYFLNNMFDRTNGFFSNFGQYAKITELLLPQDLWTAQIPYMIASIVFVFIFGMTLLIFAGIFVVRMIALAMVVMFSPVGFVAYIFPSLKKFGSDWWDALFDYAFVGPFMIFMLAVSLKIMQAMNLDNVATTFLASGQSNADNLASASWVSNAAFFSIPIILLWSSMAVGKKMGGAAAGSIISTGKKWLASNPWNKVAKPLIGAGAKKFERDVLAKRGLSPRAFLAAWKARTQSADENKISVATGAWRDRLNKFWSGGKDKTHFEDAAFQATILKKAKELGDVNQESEFLMSEYENARNRKDKKTMAAVLRMMFSNNDQNEFMKIKGHEVDPFKMKDIMFQEMVGAGFSEHEAAKQLSDFSEIAVSKGNYANYGMANFDEKAGKFKVSSKKQQIAAAAGKAKNIKAQSKTDSWHWNSFCVENELIDNSKDLTDAQLESSVDGHNLVRDEEGRIVRDKNGNAHRKVGKLHEIGLRQLDQLTPGEVNAANRVRTDFYNILVREKEILDHAASLKNIGDKENIEKGERIENFIASLKEGKMATAKKEEIKETAEKAKKETGAKADNKVKASKNRKNGSS